MATPNFKTIEKKWQNAWAKKKVFEVKESKRPKYYVLEQFPYPSGTGLHMGHAFVYTIGDIYARFKRLNGFNVMYPVGYDSFGLPAENAAIKAKSHPKKFTEDAIANFIKQQKTLGLSYDWSRMIETHKPEFYRWDQWIFLKMFEKGLAYKKESPVNWCPKCNTVLANEQVHDGRCWRHEDTIVEVKHLNQWYLKITEYADELADFKNVSEWPSLITKLQKNWIGKSFGSEILFSINGEDWPIFTTRADTIFGVTFMVVSAQHPKLMDLVTDEQKEEVEKFIEKLSSVSEEDIDKLEKEGVFTGAYAVNPVNGEKVPVYAGNFVLADYGSGMVMAVPAHDKRDFEFAKKYSIDIKLVIQNPERDRKETQVSLTSQPSLKMKEAYTDDGVLVNSGEFDGMKNREAIDKIVNFLSKKKLGKKIVNFRLRDWLISRQRFWGTPIPIINCAKCGAVPVPEKDLPVKLPDDVKFSGTENPLKDNKKFLEVKCPKCGGNGFRETDTMDTFVNSSWYYLRYLDAHNSKKIFDSKKANYWTPIDIYIGGKEHACMHDIYIRFYTKFLRDLGLIDIDEPAKKLFVQGMLHGEDGNKMSKSLGNVVDPLDTIEKYSADSLRLFLVSQASPDSDFNWSEKGVQASFKVVNRVVDYFGGVKIGKSSAKIESKLNKAVKLISDDVENFKYNLAVIKLRQLFEAFEDEIGKKDAESFLKMFSVFCPHIAEELWSKIGGKGFVCLSEWPVVDEGKINEKLEKAEEAVDRTVSDIMNILKIIKEKQGKGCEKVYVYVTPMEIEYYDEGELSKRVGKDVKVFANNDKEKYDPSEIAKKAKFGKPGIFVE